MKKNLILFLVCLITLFKPYQACTQPIEDNKPNIIIFFTDDQGYGDLGCYGAKGYKTPNIDRLADNGIRFTDFYVAATVCTPSRGALLTGKYPKQLGLHEAVIFPYSENGLLPEETTLPEILKPIGYQTACIGKWHLGHNTEEYMPNNHGFDYYYGVPYSNDMDNHFYKHNQFQAPPLPVIKNNEVVEEGPNQDFLTKMWTKEAVRFIDSSKDEPFFLYIAHSMPHLPWHVSEKFRRSSEHGIYGDIIQEIDWSMGEIINALQENGIADNTIVIFTSDNGHAPKKNGGSAGPLRGWKATTWEGGMRVPGIISWPAKLAKGVDSHIPLSTMDLLPTLANFTGASVPENANIRGRDISHLLENPEEESIELFELVYYSRDGEPEAIRQGDWKLHIRKSRGWNKEDGKFKTSLYNLKDDVGEKVNLAKQYPGLVKKLSKRLKEIDKQM